MKPIQPLLLERNNTREKTIAILFLVSFVFLIAGFAKGQGTYHEAVSLKMHAVQKTTPAKKQLVTYNRYRAFIIECTKNQVHYNYAYTDGKDKGRKIASLYPIA